MTGEYLHHNRNTQSQVPQDLGLGVPVYDYASALPSDAVAGHAAAFASFVTRKLGSVRLSHRRLRRCRVQRCRQSRRTVMHLFTLVASRTAVCTATFGSGRSGPYVPRYGL